MTVLKNNLLMLGYALYSVSLSDKFSDFGLVGAIGIDGNTLDLFSLSCRALGRNVEEIMIGFIQKEEIKKLYCIHSHQNEHFFTKLNEIFS